MRKRRKMIPLMTDNSARSARPVGTGGQKGVFWQINPFNYSHLSNKRGGTLIDFEKKIHPPRTYPPPTFLDY